MWKVENGFRNLLVPNKRVFRIRVNYVTDTLLPIKLTLGLHNSGGVARWSLVLSCTKLGKELAPILFLKISTAVAPYGISLFLLPLR